MKKVIIVHRWEATPQSDWYPWLKTELEKQGRQVVVPEMPETLTPVIDKWVSHLIKEAGVVDENTLFIGHSVGCQTILRYLEKTGNKTGGAIFVAGWFDLQWVEDENVWAVARPWIDTPIDFAKVRTLLPKVFVLLSDNDPYVAVESNQKIFEEKLGAFVQIQANAGHFMEYDEVRELPWILPLINQPT